jgi:hypothetical protein
MILALVLVLPVAYTEKIIAIQPFDFHFQHVDIPFISDILNQNILLTLISTYFSPLFLFFFLYLLLPSIIIQFGRYRSTDSNMLVSEREKSQQDRTFYSMLTSNIVITGLLLMIVGNYIYMFVKIDSVKRQEFYEQLRRTNFAFKILPELDFFLRFLIQTIFVSSAIQIFTTYIRRRTIEYERAKS